MTRLKDELERVPRYDVKDPDLAARIDSLVDYLGPYEHLDLIREVVVTAAKLVEQKASRGDLKILRTSMKEMRWAFKVFDRYRETRKVTVFGSARSRPGDPAYQAARDFSAEMARRGYMVITGAGGGIMEAGNEGAGRAMSFGLNIMLPFEQVANPAVRGDEKLINFHYFFARKLFFIKESDAIALFPGGFGTQDEAFEALTLIQTGKDDPTPLVMVDVPEGDYWKRWEEFVQGCVIGKGLASPADIHLVHRTSDIEEACDHIERFYRRYHSCRFVNNRDLLVLRLKEPLPPGLLDNLNDRFADIVVDGKIEPAEPFREEEDQPELQALPRLALRFDQKQYARLHQLIDAINA